MSIDDYFIPDRYFDELREAIDKYLSIPGNTAKSLSIGSGVPQNVISMFKNRQRGKMGSEYYWKLRKELIKNLGGVWKEHMGLQRRTENEEITQQPGIGLMGPKEGEENISPYKQGLTPPPHLQEKFSELPKIPDAPAKDTSKESKYSWLRRIDARQLGAKPPKGSPAEPKTQGGAMFVDEAQKPYTLTDNQVAVIVAMIERRYLDALTIITEILRGNRTD